MVYKQVLEFLGIKVLRNFSKTKKKKISDFFFILRVFGNFDHQTFSPVHNTQTKYSNFSLFPLRIFPPIPGMSSAIYCSCLNSCNVEVESWSGQFSDSIFNSSRRFVRLNVVGIGVPLSSSGWPRLWWRRYWISQSIKSFIQFSWTKHVRIHVFQESFIFILKKNYFSFLLFCFGSKKTRAMLNNY